VRGACPLTELEFAMLNRIGTHPYRRTPTAVNLRAVEVLATRVEVKTAIKGLLARGLLITESRRLRSSDGERAGREDWWSMTRAGRAAIGQLPHGDERA
jgi:hypothetical protein